MSNLSIQAEAAVIKRLRRAIPQTVGCKPGCTECCGPVPFSRWEWMHLRDKRNEPGPGGMCPYIENGRCAIYSERPIICRAFGNLNLLHCDVLPFTQNPNRERDVDKAVCEYNEIIEACGEWGPFAGVVAQMRELLAERMAV